MTRFFKDRKNEINLNEYYDILCDAFETTIAVCIASSSALVVNDLSKKIRTNRKLQYENNSSIAMNGVGELRIFLHRISKHLKNKQIDFIDARAPIKNIISQYMAGNCEHQSFYLAALLRQQHIPAFIYNIENIDHTIVITPEFLLDPWLGEIFSLATTDLCEVYNTSSLNMKASWLNQLLSDEKFIYPNELNLNTLGEYFVQKEKKPKKDNFCTIL
ncbi:hypothetical protein E3983_07010 [Legionella israelensis]|uniref:Transglutaminase-like domain-containing protein n=1 Tax=Legionella israelensis TaxID=454 RepID=A0AAX1EGB5_9GAMM|nr:hypothetical protein [Legionella israelensis]QBR84128.1 hypothetical protein E3983_07010 [Legionella israelensis]